LKLDRSKLIRAREMLGYSVEKTAEEAGVSKNSVLRAEHEEDIRPVTARKIAAALGVRVADLIGESETLKARRVWEQPEKVWLVWLEDATMEELAELRSEMGEALEQHQASQPRGMSLGEAKAYSETEESKRGQQLHRRTLQVIRTLQSRLDAEAERLDAEAAEPETEPANR
jgi:transcriptional regulator with XRE-family HTH domain